jgi:hypothetical protein
VQIDLVSRIPQKIWISSPLYKTQMFRERIHDILRKVWNRKKELEEEKGKRFKVYCTYIYKCTLI